MITPSIILKRNFTTSTFFRQLIRSPTQVHGVEGRYATALYSAASKKKNLNTVEADLNTVHTIYKTNSKFKDFVLDPTFKKQYKKTKMDEFLEMIGISDTSRNFISLIAENGRLNNLDAILKSFVTIMSAHRGELFCQVTTAIPLDKSLNSQLNDAFQAFIKTGQKLHLSCKVDPSIIGGMIINIGDKYVDMSVASKMKKFAIAMEGTI